MVKRKMEARPTKFQWNGAPRSKGDGENVGHKGRGQRAPEKKKGGEHKRDFVNRKDTCRKKKKSRVMDAFGQAK